MYKDNVKVRRKADGILGSARGFRLLEEEGVLYYYKVNEKGEQEKLEEAVLEYTLEEKTPIELLLEECLDMLNVSGEQLAMSLNNVIEMGTEEDVELEKEVKTFTERADQNIYDIQQNLVKIKKLLKEKK